MLEKYEILIQQLTTLIKMYVGVMLVDPINKRVFYVKSKNKKEFIEVIDPWQN